jgi:hypothetical protein
MSLSYKSARRFVMLCAVLLLPQDRSMKIADARAVITGGASGLGLAVARHITRPAGASPC